MGAISLSGALTPLLLAGEKARRMAELLSPLGADLRVLEGGRPGDAVSLKLLRSIFTKGMEALTVECLIAAEHFGVREQLFTVLSDLDKVPLRAFMEMLLRTHVVHAGRRHHEVIEAEKQLVREKLPTYVLPGVRALFANTCAALNREPMAASSPDAKQALSWLQQASTAGGR
jgi:3-hydroxyisobutyrate dehydrogenase-like beta-hydroxyacid dehydrogenase